MTAPNVIPRAQHSVSRSEISENSLKVLYRLKKAGYAAFLVGGGVRDLLLGLHPKDFDVATDARPEEVRKLFRNSRLIGRRFRLVHVFFGRDIVEVSTFRALHDPAAEEHDERRFEDGLLVRDNVYGTIEEDAWRRDFTVNALYYNIDDFSIWDYVGGMADLEARRLRMIGDPAVRYREDPVRMLRAARFAAKLGFEIEPGTRAPIAELKTLLEAVPPARLFDETIKLFLTGHARASFEALHELDLFGELFPQSARALAGPEGERALAFMRAALDSTDARIAEGKPVTLAFLLAAFLWYPVQAAGRYHEEQGTSPALALRLGADEVVREQNQRVGVPRRFTTPVMEIWAMQRRLAQAGGKRALRMLGHPRFRAAYDFLVLRAEAGEPVAEHAEWWTRLQEAEESERPALAQRATQGKRRRRRRGRRRGRAAEGSESARSGDAQCIE